MGVCRILADSCRDWPDWALEGMKKWQTRLQKLGSHSLGSSGKGYRTLEVGSSACLLYTVEQGEGLLYSPAPGDRAYSTQLNNETDLGRRSRGSLCREQSSGLKYPGGQLPWALSAHYRHWNLRQKEWFSHSHGSKALGSLIRVCPYQTNTPSLRR